MARFTGRRILMRASVCWSCLLAACSAFAQPAPYIGYVYPAGGQQGTTFQIRLGGQRLDGVDQVLVSGPGVSAKIVSYRRQLGAQETALLREQLRELGGGRRGRQMPVDQDEETRALVARLENRIGEFTPRPASAALASVVIAEVTAEADAPPGAREIRLLTSRGISNPLVFHIGQVPETTRKPMSTCPFQVLGKENLALRKRPPEEAEVRISLPCTANGQIASGEVNRYRFAASQGARIVMTVAARQLVPYIADAVPGWFQPVLTLYDSAGREVAYGDDFQFKPDPTICWEVPVDGEYVVAISDAIFRGREDFVYRLTIGQLPVITSIFPLGGRLGEPAAIAMQGWNLEHATLMPPADDAGPGTHLVVARSADGYVSNRVPFALSELPECLDAESNDAMLQAQAVKPPVTVNGRIDRPGDWDVFRVTLGAGDTIVADVQGRELDSPIDSILKLTDADGKVLAISDDREDPTFGVNTHHADSYIMVQVPVAGDYFVHLGDTAHAGGQAYAYRLRISPPQPDFVLRVLPSGLGIRSQGAAPLSVYAIRQDGFDGTIRLSLKNPPEGFRTPGARLAAETDMARLPVRTSLTRTDEPVALQVEGRARIGDREVVREAVPADDRMQAFLWRHLVPAQDLQALVFDPRYEPPATRVPPPLTDEQKAAAAAKLPQEKAKFTERQVAGRLRQLKALYEEWLLTDDFYNRKVAECEAVR